MARIAGVELPKNKRAFVGLTFIFGIGRTQAYEILQKADIDANKVVSELSADEEDAIRKVIADEYKVEGALRSEIQMNIKRLMDIGSYRGIRHRKGLPVRGQRSKTNARTRKGKRRTIGGLRKTVTKK